MILMNGVPSHVDGCSPAACRIRRIRFSPRSATSRRSIPKSRGGNNCSLGVAQRLRGACARYPPSFRGKRSPIPGGVSESVPMRTLFLHDCPAKTDVRLARPAAMGCGRHVPRPRHRPDRPRRRGRRWASSAPRLKGRGTRASRGAARRGDLPTMHRLAEKFPRLSVREGSRQTARGRGDLPWATPAQGVPCRTPGQALSINEPGRENKCRCRSSDCAGRPR
jgi:hypothetical protein